MSVDDRVFLARYEFPKYGEGFQFSAAVSALTEAEDSAPAAFIDFLTGFPIDCVEMLVFLGEYSSAPDPETGITKINVQQGMGATAPVWDGMNSRIFTWPEPEKILLNLTALANKSVGKIMAENLEGEPKPKEPHWWYRVLVSASDKKFPIPGEFVALGVRMFPGEYWGRQLSSPFIYSGNWFDTVYLTGGRITEVIEPTDLVAYPTYKVAWRSQEFTANPSDFAEYRVDNRVTILKDCSTDKKTQLWKDEDMKPECDKTSWQILPLSFYGMDGAGEGG